MFKEITARESTGKTVKQMTAWDDMGAVLFEDGTFVGITIGKDHYGEPYLDFTLSNKYDISAYSLCKLGIINDKEYEKMMQEEKEEWKRERRRLLEELKAEEVRGEL